MDDYIKALNKRRSFIFISILLIISTTLLIVYNVTIIQFIFLFITIQVIGSLALYFGLQLGNSKFRQFSNGQYFVDNSTLKFVTPDDQIKQFQLDKIAVVHKTHSGTVLVKGDKWTKLNYIRPKRSGYQIDDPNVIFIPTITSNYTSLISVIKQTAMNSMKL